MNTYMNIYLYTHLLLGPLCGLAACCLPRHTDIAPCSRSHPT